MKADNLYEVAFEEYLRRNSVAALPIIEVRRSYLDESSVKSPDFLVISAADSRLVVDVKGRKFGGSKEKPRRIWQNWCLRDDVISLERWTNHFGPGFRGILAFVYRIVPELELAPHTEDAFYFRDELYLVRGVEVALSRRDANAKPQVGDRSCLNRLIPGNGQAVLALPRGIGRPISGLNSREHSVEWHRITVSLDCAFRCRNVVMNPLRIGVVVESTGLPLRQAIAQAAKMAAEGIEANATGDLAHDSLGETGRRELRNLLRSFSQELAALNVPLRRGLDSDEHHQQRLDHVCKVMQLAFDLGARRVVAPLPKIPDDPTTLRARTMRESLTALGTHGDRVGTVLALEIGFDSAETVKEYLSSFDTGSLKITFDPANMLIHGHEPLRSLTPLKGLLGHVHARDARTASLSRGMEEVVCAGDADWMALTATLQVLDFDGFLTVKRDQGEDKLRDVSAGVKFLRRFIATAS